MSDHTPRNPEPLFDLFALPPAWARPTPENLSAELGEAFVVREAANGRLVISTSEGGPVADYLVERDQLVVLLAATGPGGRALEPRSLRAAAEHVASELSRPFRDRGYFVLPTRAGEGVCAGEARKRVEPRLAPLANEIRWIAEQERMVAAQSA